MKVVTLSLEQFIAYCNTSTDRNRKRDEVSKEFRATAILLNKLSVLLLNWRACSLAKYTVSFQEAGIITDAFSA